MKADDTTKEDRRRFLQSTGAGALALALGVLPLRARGADKGGGKMKIGIVGSGNVGGALGAAWVKAGHEVMFSSLHIENDRALAARLGPKRRARPPPSATCCWSRCLTARCRTSAGNWQACSRARW